MAASGRRRSLLRAILEIFRQGFRAGLQWYLTDRLGTVRDLVNSSAAVIDHVDYSVFGNILNESNPTIGDRFKYSEMANDSSTGLDDFRTRYYDAAIGRFPTQDPIKLASGTYNLYQYVYNNPDNLVDPTGQIAFVPLVLILVVGGIFFGPPLVANAPLVGDPNIQGPDAVTSTFLGVLRMKKWCNALENLLNGLSGGGGDGGEGPDGGDNEPPWVYRGDNRPPDEAFITGLPPWGTNMNIDDHIDNFDPTPGTGSGFVGTSVDPIGAGNFLGGDPGYLYQIANPNWSVNVNALMNLDSNENEFAFPGGVPANLIKGAWQCDSGDSGPAGPFNLNPNFGPPFRPNPGFPPWFRR
jgi:RHS repeat-associated protein